MTDPRCGSVAGYCAHHDRHEPPCQACRIAHADWQRHYRTRIYFAGGPMTIDATGTRRRLQALMRIGWSSAAIATATGVTPPAIRQWMTNRRVRRGTARTVADLYDRWWDQPGPSTATSTRAARNGWALPQQWDDDQIDDPAARPWRVWARTAVFDDVAVQRAMCGDPVHLRPTERAEAIRRLTAQGLSAAQIAARLGMDKRSVVRQRGREVA